MADDEDRIVFVQVGYVARDEDVPSIISLEEIRRTCRPDRVTELIADLMLLCFAVDRDRKIRAVPSVLPRAELSIAPEPGL